MVKTAPVHERLAGAAEDGGIEVGGTDVGVESGWYPGAATGGGVGVVTIGVGLGAGAGLGAGGSL